MSIIKKNRIPSQYKISYFIPKRKNTKYDNIKLETKENIIKNSLTKSSLTESKSRQNFFSFNKTKDYYSYTFYKKFNKIAKEYQINTENKLELPSIQIDNIKERNEKDNNNKYFKFNFSGINTRIKELKKLNETSKKKKKQIQLNTSNDNTTSNEEKTNCETHKKRNKDIYISSYNLSDSTAVNSESKSNVPVEKIDSNKKNLTNYRKRLTFSMNPTLLFKSNIKEKASIRSHDRINIEPTKLYPMSKQNTMKKRNSCYHQAFTMHSTKDRLIKNELRYKKKELSKYKKRVDAFIENISVMIGSEYELCDNNNEYFSLNNICRVIELRRLQKGYNPQNEIEPKLNKKNRIKENEIINNKKLHLRLFCPPHFIKKKGFKETTIKKYNSIMKKIGLN